jgi:soluble lytic murein transglycosylase
MHLAVPRRCSPPSRALLLLIGFAFLVCIDTSRANDRDDFLAAERALATGDFTTVERLADGLHEYPLYPYLRFEEITRSLHRVPAHEVEQFLTDYADTPLAPRLRRAWLNRLAREGRWTEYVRLYQPDDSVERRCLYLHGLIALGRHDQAFAQVEPLWLSGKSRPDPCDSVFDAWQEAGLLTTDLVWRRVALAMDNDNTGLARYVGRLLPDADQVWLDRWLTAHRKPERILDGSGFESPHPQREAILVHAIKRLARGNPGRAADAWDRVRSRYDVPPALASQAAAAVGFALARDDDRRALEYLDGVRATAGNVEVQERRLRTALKLGDWKRVAAWIDALPQERRDSEQWLYWKARAAEATDQPDAARTLYASAADERSLWGFLAAERVDSPYKLDNVPTPATPERIAAIANGPAARRIGELRALGRDLDVRREWYHVTREMDGEDLEAAAVLARAWGWPDRAIFTLAKSGYWDDLDLRFPLLHRDLVCAQANATALDPSWIYAVIRQESAFAPEAVSRAGAMGLMQLMPTTALSVARTIGETIPSRRSLYEPPLNIALGSRFLAKMSERFGGNEILATAAYNAGPDNVEKWLPKEPVAADVWIATIPFRETREYVRRVLAYRLIYDDRLGRNIVPLSQLLQPIGSGQPRTADGRRSRDDPAGG